MDAEVESVMASSQDQREEELQVIITYYIDTDVLLKNIPLVKFIKNTSGTRVVYFP